MVLLEQKMVEAQRTLRSSLDSSFILLPLFRFTELLCG